MNETIPNLNIELQSFKDAGDQILLEQDNCMDYTDRISIHPIHLRYMAEKMGLIQTSEVPTQQTIEALQRRLVTLRSRIDHLADYLTNHSDHEHADLSYERIYAVATAEIADHFCTEITGRTEVVDAAEKQP